MLASLRSMAFDGVARSSSSLVFSRTLLGNNVALLKKDGARMFTTAEGEEIPREKPKAVALNNMKIDPKSIAKINFDNIPVYDFQRQQVDTMSLPEEVFGAPLRTDILQRVLVWEQAGKRQGTHKAKTRGEIAGSTRKLRPQKGSGHARAGGRGPPHHRGGGNAFPPVPRDHSFSLNKKIVQFGYRVALSTKLAQERLFIFQSTELQDHKTKNLVKLLNENWVYPMLIIDSGMQRNMNFRLASNNLQAVKVAAANELSVYNILRNSHVAIARDALPHIINYLMPKTSLELHYHRNQHLDSIDELEEGEEEEEVEVEQPKL